QRCRRADAEPPSGTGPDLLDRTVSAPPTGRCGADSLTASTRPCARSPARVAPASRSPWRFRQGGRRGSYDQIAAQLVGVHVGAHAAFHDLAPAQDHILVGEFTGE